jgi:hypothetical protein
MNRFIEYVMLYSRKEVPALRTGGYYGRWMPIPNEPGDVKYVEWVEDEDPYSKNTSMLPNQGLG